MIDYLAELYVRFLILLSCCGWAALVFWGIIFIAEKICRWVYQDDAQYPPPLQELEQHECCDCGMLKMLDEDERCDLCVAIFNAELKYYGYSRADRELHREIVNEQLRF